MEMEKHRNELLMLYYKRIQIIYYGKQTNMALSGSHE